MSQISHWDPLASLMEPIYTKPCIWWSWNMKSWRWDLINDSLSFSWKELLMSLGGLWGRYSALALSCSGTLMSWSLWRKAGSFEEVARKFQMKKLKDLKEQCTKSRHLAYRGDGEEGQSARDQYALSQTCTRLFPHTAPSASQQSSLVLSLLYSRKNHSGIIGNHLSW